jgi:hypothetical protein
MDLSKKPNFGPLLITTTSGEVIENPQRERNAIGYLLQILDVRQRGEFIIGCDGGSGMDSLEGSAYRVAKLVEELKGQAVAIGISDEWISRIANAIRETTSDEMIKHLKDLSDLEVVTLAAKQATFVEEIKRQLVLQFPRRVHNLSLEK